MKKQKIFISANQKELRDERFAIEEVIVNITALFKFHNTIDNISFKIYNNTERE